MALLAPRVRLETRFLFVRKKGRYGGGLFAYQAMESETEFGSYSKFLMGKNGLKSVWREDVCGDISV